MCEVSLFRKNSIMKYEELFFDFRNANYIGIITFFVDINWIALKAMEINSAIGYFSCFSEK